MHFIEEMSETVDRKKAALFRDDSKELSPEEPVTKIRTIRGTSKFLSNRIGIRPALVNKSQKHLNLVLSSGDSITNN